MVAADTPATGTRLYGARVPDPRAAPEEEAVSWNRKLWAVEMSTLGKDPMLISVDWNNAGASRYQYEPARCLLFQNRKAARVWCRSEEFTYHDRLDSCKDWRFRPVRVRETVKRL